MTKMSQVFALQMMYNDIWEPMDALTEIEKTSGRSSKRKLMKKPARV